ncbi:MAG: hypothetical protein EA425_04120 [Puniceicoccaceae bacterium]|nr:MAG: hypothetical protein EA425_04120 [Puniceicoccaceae bacterium]
MRFPNFLAIDCGASRVSAVLLAYGPDGEPTLKKFFTHPLIYDAGDDEEWLGSVSQALEKLSGELSARGQIDLVIPGHLTLTKFLKIPHVDASKRAKIVQFEAQQNIPYPLSEVVWDFQTVADDGVDFEVAINAIKLEIAHAVCDRSEAAGFPPDRIEPSCTAQVNAFHYNYADSLESTLLLNIGAKSTDLIFIKEERYFIRNIALAGNTITQGLADALQKSFPEAEVLKRDHLGPAAEGNDPEVAAAGEKALDSFVGRLALEITRSVGLYRRQCGAEAPLRVFLTGGGSLVENLAEKLEQRLRTPVGYYEPLRRIQVDPEVDADSVESYSHFIGEAIGAALKPSDSIPTQFNLLPPKVASQRSFRKQQPLLLGAALFLAGSVALPIISNNAAISAFDEKITNIEDILRPHQERDRVIREELERVQDLARKGEQIQRVALARTNWLDLLTDLQERLTAVEDVWLDSFELVRGGGGGQAGGPGGGGLFGAQPQQPQPQADAQASVLRIEIAGRLLDRNNPVSTVSEDSLNRVSSLLQSIADSTYIRAVVNERFDTSQPGILRFECVLEVDPRHPL